MKVIHIENGEKMAYRKKIALKEMREKLDVWK